MALPFFVFVEALDPLIEGIGYLLVPIAFLLRVRNVSFLLFVAVGLGTLMSWLSAFSELYGFRRDVHPRDVDRSNDSGSLLQSPTAAFDLAPQTTRQSTRYVC